MRRRSTRLLLLGAGLIAVLVLGNYRAGAQVLRQAFEAIVRLTGGPLAASHGVLSEHEIQEIDHLPAQGQAERLLQRAINHYDGAAELIEQRVDGWLGQLQYSDTLNALIYAAYNSSDLRVRAAAVEVSLAMYGYEKSAGSADRMIVELDQDSQDRPHRLWVLGLLANRGVEVDRVFRVLQHYLRDPDEDTRKWAVNSLALLGSDETIPVLLEVFRYEPSMIVKERAACSLAESGMLTKEQRQQAVPEFLRLMDDHSLDSTARGWAFQALRDISGQRIGDDPAAWRNWASSAGAL